MPTPDLSNWKQHDYSGAIHATTVRGLEIDPKDCCKLGLLREDLAQTTCKCSSDFSDEKENMCSVN